MPSSTSSVQTLSNEKTSILEFLSNKKFHKKFTVPANETRGPLAVSYAIAGLEEGDVPTIFFCGGMFGSRWQAAYLDFLAEKEGVRVLFLDRPGFGASTQVPLQDRLSTFLEVSPLLLSHLKISHVALASHSAGTIYALNFLHAYPDLLYPKNPSLTLLAPFVHPSKSGVSFLYAASLLPDTLLNHWSGLMGFLINSVNPKLDSSGGAITGFSSVFRLPSSKAKTEQLKVEEDKKVASGYGLTKEGKKELDRLIFKNAFAEQSVGANEEARLCLKSLGSTWGAWDDSEGYVEEMRKFWEGRSVGPDGEIVNERKLSVTVHFAEDDVMIGQKGRKYFEKCWTQETCGRGVVLELMEAKGTNHDSVADASNIAMPALFSRVKAAWEKGH
ncbi:Alpha/Beta hydrolase protein [Xylogone sp. PMI_703]|nr:Alpha/Beta hydrolase protein [Xylogone sp. PMI_703]